MALDSTYGDRLLWLWLRSQSWVFLCCCQEIGEDKGRYHLRTKIRGRSSRIAGRWREIDQGGTAGSRRHGVVVDFDRVMEGGGR